MKHALFIGVALLSLLVFTGCEWFHDKPLVDPSIAVDEVRGKLLDTSTGLKSAGEGVKKDAGVIREKVPAATKPFVEPELKDIEKHGDYVILTSATILAMGTKLDEATGQIGEYKTRLEDKQKEVDAANARADGVLMKLIVIVFAISCAGGVACALAAVFIPASNKIFLGTCSAVCFAVAGLAMAANKFYEPICWTFAGLAVVGIVGFAIWFIRKLRGKDKEIGAKEEELDVHKTAAVDLTQAIEIVKAGLLKLGDQGVELRKKLFGDGIAATGEIFHNNSKTTDTIVKDIRTSGEVSLAPPVPIAK